MQKKKLIEGTKQHGKSEILVEYHNCLTFNCMKKTQQYDL